MRTPSKRHAANLPWIVALATLAVLLALCRVVVGAHAYAKPAPLPTEWTLTARPVFSTDERRVYRQLREALPHHIVLSKLPLVRFSPAHRPAAGALLVRVARRDPRHLRHLQRQWTRARCHRSGHRPRQLAPGAADQAVGARCLPRALPALPGGPPAVDPRAAAARAAKHGRRARHRSLRRAWTPARDTLGQRRGLAASRALARCGRTRASSRTPSSAPKVAPIRAPPASSAPSAASCAVASRCAR